MLLADGGAEAGLGHVSRVTGLAAALDERGVIASIALLEQSDQTPALDAAGAVVLDSYRLTPADLPTGAPVAAFHDFGEPPAGAALVIDGSNLEHACLRPAFWDLPRREVDGQVCSVLVATGSGGALGPELATGVLRALPSAQVVLVRGPYARGQVPEGVEVAASPVSLAKLLVQSDLAVLAAGQTMLEAAAAGTPTVAVVLAENQRRQAATLAERGAVVLADRFAVADEVSALADDPDRRRRLSAQAQVAVDGQGARRVAALVEELA